MYSKLFQPVPLGPRVARNRIIFGSHTTNFARQNRLSQRHIDYYTARAAGGAGMLVLEEHIVHPSDLPYEYAIQGYQPNTSRAIASVTKAIHAQGALALVQLNHTGQQGVSDHHQRELWAPSSVPNVATREVPKEMELSDIHAVIAGFTQVARTAIEGGADGVELQVADSSLLRQFLSPLTNQRADLYGGSLENRLRFLQETIEGVDAAIGSNNILGIRLCADELAPWAGLTPEQSGEIAQLLTSTHRIDYMTITMGSIFSTQMFPFNASMRIAPGYATSLAARIKAIVTIPIFAAGRIMNAAQAERILVEEQADGVEMIRPLIADPQLPLLSQQELAHRVRPCIACNQGCQVRNMMNVALSCSVNPDVIHTQSLQTEKRTARSSQQAIVYIVGGGPAGLEAARTAATRGRRVILYEREDTLGGAVALAAKGTGREELRSITDYLQSEIERLDVAIHTGVEVTADMLLKQQPGAVILATGALTGTGLLPISGHDLPFVSDVRRILRGEPAEGQRVVVIDETGAHGVYSVIEMLATMGKSVEVITEDWYVGHDLVSTHDIVQWQQNVMSQGVVFTTHTTVLRIEPGLVIITDRFVEGEQARPADCVVLGTYERPAQALYYALKGRIPRLFRVGDCNTPRRIEQAMYEGRLAGEQA